MIYSDLHAHTNYCDGKNSPEEMVLSAIDKGLKEIGLVVHAYTEFDAEYCVDKGGEACFQKEMARLKDKYADKIKVLCGIEQDVHSTSPTDGFDYVLVSNHYFKVNGKYYNVDFNEEYFKRVVKERFGGDYYSASENYFENLVTSPFMKKADIIGHFDLISKFNESDKLFDSENPRYVSAYTSALKELVKINKPFELNTGAISRGCRTHPYPSGKQIQIIKSLGGKLILSSDAHRAENLAFKFDEFESLL